MPKTIRKSSRLSEEHIEFVEGLSEDKNFTEGLERTIEIARKSMNNRVEVTTQKEIVHEKTVSPQITSFMAKEPTPTPLIEGQIPPCEYASIVVKTSKQGLEYLAFCDNPKKTHLPRNRLIPISACQKCYLRMREPLRVINKDMRSFCCWTTSVEELSELPCVKNPDLECEDGKKGERPCPLIIHKEWRRLF